MKSIHGKEEGKLAQALQQLEFAGSPTWTSIMSRKLTSGNHK